MSSLLALRRELCLRLPWISDMEGLAEEAIEGSESVFFCIAYLCFWPPTSGGLGLLS
jgi:hypothetical protein